MIGTLSAIQTPDGFVATGAFAFRGDPASPARRRCSEALGVWRSGPAIDLAAATATADAKTNHLQPLGLLGGTSG